MNSSIKLSRAIILKVSRRFCHSVNNSSYGQQVNTKKEKGANKKTWDFLNISSTCLFKNGKEKKTENKKKILS